VAPITTPSSSHWAGLSGKGIDFGLIFFSSNEASFDGDRYRLVIESTKYADQHGFSSIWIPERHFTKDGWLYPNPAVLQAALARETSRIHLRAGSVVVPLHNPLRVAEEWAMVDNLSGGRVGVSFASGWHPNDFSLAPDNYADRSEIMYRNIEIVRKLWRGESVPFKGGDGKMIELKTYPPPIQRDIPTWLTAAGNPKTFAGAGKIGMNLLTHMYNQSVDELAEKIRIYRDARAEAGYDPATGLVSVMLHTYVGADMDTVRAQIQEPFSEYLKSASYLVNAIAYSRGQQVDLSTLSEQDLQDYLNFVTDRLISQQRVLFGTSETCAPLVAQLQAAGVNEIACQMDFGVDIDLVLRSMPYLNKLREQSNTQNDTRVDTSPTSTYPLLLEHEQTSEKHGSNGNGLHSTTLPQTNGQSPAVEISHLQAPFQNDIAYIQRRCQEEVHLPTFYQRLSDHGIQLTGSFQSITRLWRRDSEALGQIQLTSSLQEDSDLYQIHPTLLDSCFQVIIATLPDALFQQGEVLYLPTAIRSFQLHARPGTFVWSHAQLDTTIDPSANILEGDVRILDEQGNLIAEAKGLQLLRSEIGTGSASPAPARSPLQTTHTVVADSKSADTQNEINNWLYQLRWEAIKLPRQTASSQPGHWLIFMDKKGVGQRLAQKLQVQGHTYSLIEPGESFQVIDHQHYRINPASPQDVGTALAAVRTTPGRNLPLRGVIHLWSLNTTPVTATNLSTLEADQILGTQSALSLIQAMVAEGSTAQIRLWFITQGAQPVEATDTELAISQSPIWGLGKTCAMEHPELWGGLIDLDPHKSGSQPNTNQLMTILLGDLHEDQIALRGTTAYVARMVRLPAPKGQHALHLSRDAAYLITGGLWGLGLEIARWFAMQGARTLILLGRSKLPPKETWDQIEPASRQGIQIAGIRSIEQLGAQVHFASIDVTDSAQLASFLHHYQQQGKPQIRGVIHAASVWQDAQGQSLVRPLVNLHATDLATVMRPKMLGAWLLSSLFKETSLDFFVSFSSGASLFGSAAQGNYAAASEFLDVLAYYQRAHGQPAISIDWGAISEIGFGATPEGLRVHEYWESRGIQRISPKQVLSALALLIPQNLTRVGVLRLDWQLLRQFYPQITAMPLVSQLVEVEHIPDNAGHNTSRGEAPAHVLQALHEAQTQEHSAILTAYVQEQVANVLHVSMHRLDTEQPLTTLGLDSLMAIELKNRIELDLQIRIPIVTFLQGPSITQFVNQILTKLDVDKPLLETVGVAGSVQGQSTATGLAQGAIPTLPSSSSIGSTATGSAQGAIPTDVGPNDANDGNDAAQLLAQLDQLSDQDVNSLLSQMLSEEEQKENDYAAISEEISSISADDAEQLLTQLDQLTDAQVDALLSQLVQKDAPGSSGDKKSSESDKETFRD
jgi:phthiocerol/phenolphthiocerol synthesis type-I polyketide synthase D